jgi:cysteine desulfurase / selenocysteine lyase
MSTSDQINDPTGRLTERVPADAHSIDQAGGFPDVAMLARMANEFFHGQPAPVFPGGVAPSVPDAGFAGSAFETTLPEFGMPLPGMPAIPSAGKPDMPGMSSATPELSTFHGAPGQVAPGQVTAVALPDAGSFPSLQYDPRSATAAVPTSPFSLPLPEFDLALFPSFGAGLPTFAPLAPLLSENEAKAALTEPSSFYFLDNAGSRNGSAMVPAHAVSPTELSSRPDPDFLPGRTGQDRVSAFPLKKGAWSASTPPSPTGNSGERSGVEGPAVYPAAASPFSLPLPEFDRALFPSFAAGLPTFAPLAPLLSENEAKAALTEPSSFYFLEQAGLLTASDKAAKDKAAKNAPEPNISHPAGVGDLKLPRQQFDIGSVRRDFPILQERVNGRPLIWLDNAATTQKPQSVIDRLSYFYEHENSNIHRAAHELAARATDAYEDARTKVAHFLNASSSKEIVFVRGATEAINLVAQSWGRRHINKGDEIVITWIEHHANIVPWQMLCAEKGACLRVAPVDDDGQILLDEYEKLLSPKTRLVSFTQVSNALGTMTPAHQMVQMAHRYGARVLLDGAQAVSHMPIDVQSLDCDFYVFSGHKVFAPTGIGVLYGKPEVLAETPPWQGGGNMIVDVTFEKTTYQPPPGRFEAGTGNIADAVGLGAAIDYLDHIGMSNIARYEHELLVYATQGLLRVPGLRIIGTAKEKAGVLSFVLAGFRTEEVGAALNREGIAVRSGHHCAQPTLRRFGVETTVRPSLALYNSFEDIDALIAALFRLKNLGA